MARAGRPPKPTHLKLLAGNPGKRPLNEREPQPERKIPPCPSHLGPEAKREWKKISKQLYILGLLSMIDRAALACYCQAWSDWLDATEKLQLTGKIVKTKTGYPILSPYMTIANKAMKQMKEFLTEFGMTPASRSRIQVALPGDSAADEKAKKRKLLFG